LISPSLGKLEAIALVMEGALNTDGVSAAMLNMTVVEEQGEF
jgi:hypothetical protein